MGNESACSVAMVDEVHTRVLLAQGGAMRLVECLAPTCGVDHAHANMSEAIGLLERASRLVVAARREVEARRAEKWHCVRHNMRFAGEGCPECIRTLGSSTEGPLIPVSMPVTEGL